MRTILVGVNENLTRGVNLSLWVSLAILVPVVGALLYAFFASEKSTSSRRITAFGEAPEDLVDDHYDRIGRMAR